jgi:diguanylate cyclase (GGDEF)-like protein
MALVLAAALPSVVLVISGAEQLRISKIAEARREALTLAHTGAFLQSEMIERARTLLALIAGASAVHDAVASPDLAAGCHAFLRQTSREVAWAQNLWIARADGSFVCGNASLTSTVNMAARDYFRQALASNAFTLSDQIVGQRSGLPLIVAALPFGDGGGGPRAVALASVESKWLGRALEVGLGDMRVGAGFSAEMIDGANRRVARIPETSTSRLGSRLTAEDAAFHVPRDVGDGVREVTLPSGRAVVVAFARLPGSDVRIVVQVPTDNIVGPLDAERDQQVLVVIGVAVLSLVAAWLLAELSVLSWLRRIGQVADRVGRGELDARVRLPRVAGELSELGERLNRMASRLLEREKSIIERSVYLDALVRFLPDGVQSLDAGLKLVAWNDRLWEVLQLDGRAILASEDSGRAIRLALAGRGDLGPGMVDVLVQQFEHLFRSPVPFTTRLRLAGGGWVEVRGTPMPDGGYLALYRDVTEEEQRTIALRDAKAEADLATARLRDGIESMSDGLILWDRDDRLALFNSVALTMQTDGLPLLEGVTWVEHMHQRLARGSIVEAVGNEEAYLERRKRARREQPDVTVEYTNSAGRTLRVRDRHTGDGGIISILTDVTAERRREAELIALATTDPLTGLNNRRAFVERAIGERERAIRHDRSAGLLLLDLDHFKRINDEFGHEAGDTTLRVVADVLRARTRRIDCVGRLGGEELGVLLPDTDAANAHAVAEKLRVAIAELEITAPDGRTFKLTTSGGLTDLRRAANLDEAMRLADGALYEAKRAGRDRIVVVAAGTDGR